MRAPPTSCAGRGARRRKPCMGREASTRPRTSPFPGRHQGSRGTSPSGGRRMGAGQSTSTRATFCSSCAVGARAVERPGGQAPQDRPQLAASGTPPHPTGYPDERTQGLESPFLRDRGRRVFVERFTAEKQGCPALSIAPAVSAFVPVDCVRQQPRGSRGSAAGGDSAFP